MSGWHTFGVSGSSITTTVGGPDDGSGSLDGNSPPISVDTWYTMEIHTNITDPGNPGSGILETYFNGTLIGSVTYDHFSPQETWFVNAIAVGLTGYFSDFAGGGYVDGGGKIHFNNIRVGTARHGGDIVSNIDFSTTGSLSSFDHIQDADGNLSTDAESLVATLGNTWPPPPAYGIVDDLQLGIDGPLNTSPNQIPWEAWFQYDFKISQLFLGSFGLFVSVASADFVGGNWSIGVGFASVQHEIN